jgi:hypothetical protein
MKKKNYHPYLLPLVKSYADSKFLKESKIILKFLRKSSLRTVKAVEDEFWIYVQETKPKKKSTSKKPWMPKLYICVQPDYFWPLVFDLVSLSKLEKFSWKFCKDLTIFGRPDKIVIYADSENESRKIFSKVRPLLKGKKFHKLLFARPSKQEGVYFGVDPTFIKKASWRYYRWLLEETLIKPNLKRGTLDHNTRQAIDALNISLKHQGPKSLNPSAKNVKFIKQVWKEINSD